MPSWFIATPLIGHMTEFWILIYSVWNTLFYPIFSFTFPHILSHSWLSFIVQAFFSNQSDTKKHSEVGPLYLDVKLGDAALPVLVDAGRGGHHSLGHTWHRSCTKQSTPHYISFCAHGSQISESTRHYISSCAHGCEISCYEKYAALHQFLRKRLWYLISSCAHGCEISC